MRPNVTVVIPVYNTEKFLKEALDSVLMQSLKNIEILCINDGSSDASQQILDEYAAKDKRIRIIVNPQNKGIGAVRNQSIDAASAKYAAILSSDDYYTSKNTLKKYYKTISKSDNIFSVMTKSFILTRKGKIEARKGYCPPRIYNNDLIKKHNIRYVEEYTHEDWAFELECLLCKITHGYQSILINGKWWVYRKREDKTSITDNANNTVHMMYVYGIIEKKIREKYNKEQLKVFRILACYAFRNSLDWDSLVERRELIQRWNFQDLLIALNESPLFNKKQKHYLDLYIRVNRNIKQKRIGPAYRMTFELQKHIYKIQKTLQF